MQAEKNEYEEKPLKAAGHYLYDQFSKGFDSTKLYNQNVPMEASHTKVSIDDVAVGSKNQNMMLEEFPKDYDPSKIQEDNNEQQIPLQQRLKSKVFKQRQQALEALYKIFEELNDDTDPIFQEYFQMFVPFIQDSHPMCQEKALNVIVIWLKKFRNFKELSDEKVIEICRNILEKAYSSGKPNAKSASLEIFCLFYEKGHKSNVINSILCCFQNKNNKISCGAISIISELLENFGPKQLNYLKDFYNAISGLSESSQSTIKQCCINFYKDAYKWMGDSIKVFTKQLKKQQQDELENFFNSYERVDLKPLRVIEEAQEGKGKKNDNEINQYDLVEAKDVYKSYQDDWCQKLLLLTKWQEKVEMMNFMIKDLCYPKHQPTNFYPLFSLTKKLLNEQNYNILQIGIKVSGLMAEGLRKVFSNSAKNLIHNLLQKLKDKKTFIVNETQTAILSFINYCMNLEEISEDLKVQLSDKNPSFKANIINLLEKILEKNPNPSKTGFKSILSTIKKLFDDGNPEVREKSLVLFGKLKNLYGDSFIGNLLQDVNQKQLQKINSLCQQPINTQSVAMIEEKPVAAQQNQNNLPSIEVQQKSNNMLFSLDQCLEKLIQMGYSEDTFKKLSYSQEQKLFALQELSIQQIIPGSESFLLCVLKYKFKDWKDANMMKEVCQLVEKLSQSKQDEKFLPIYMELILEKISDYKFIDTCSEILKNLCKKMGPKPSLQILAQCLDIKKANPKTLENLQLNLIKLIQSFNIKHMPIKILVDLMKELLLHQNSNVKKEAINLGKVLYQYIGKDFKNMINDLTGNPQKMLLQEIEKTSVLSELQKKTLQCETIEEVMEEEEIVSNVVTKRTDISRDIPVIMRQLNDNDWKIRKDGLEKLQSLISENYNQISLNGLRDLIDTLKNKLSDPNKGLVIKFVQFIGQFAEAAGPDIKKYEKALLPALISNLSDKQITLRQDVIISIEKFARIIGIESILNHFPPFLNHESMELKKDILTWVLQNRDYLSKIDLKPYINPILNQLTSKQKEIRQLAEELLSVISTHITMNNLFNQMSSFKPAIQQQLKQIIERVYGMNMMEDYQQISIAQKSVGKIAPSIQNISLKEQRIINERLNPWPCDYLNDCLVNILQQDFITQDIPIELVNQLFSRDFRRNVEAATFIRLNLTQAAEISDLIIKWSFMMLFTHTNNDIAQSILSMYISLIDILHIENYQLMDFESSILLNSITCYMKINKNIVKFDIDLIIKIFEQIKHIVYSNIIVSFLFQKLQDSEYFSIQDEILKILGKVYINDIGSYLGHLAQIPDINCKVEFMENLQQAYGQAELSREGFIKLPQNKTKLQPEIQQPYNNLQPFHYDRTSLISTPGKYSIILSLKIIKDTNNLNWEQKINEINQIYEYWTNETYKKQPLLDINEIFEYIIEIFQQFVKNKHIYQSPTNFVLDYTNLINKILSDKDVVYNIPSKTLHLITQIMLNQMVNENENKNDSESEQMVKIINTLTIKLLEYSDWMKMIIALFDIFIETKNEEEEYSKRIGLIVKCILKQAKAIEKSKLNINIQELLLKFHEYNVCFIKPNQQFNNDIGAKTIKTVLRTLILQYGSEVMMENYKIINSRPEKDEYIFIWITSLIGEIQSQNQSNDKNMSIVALRKSQIKQQLQQIQNNIDEKMQPIVEGIVKNEEIDKNIQLLQELIQQNPQLQWSGYFSQFQNSHEYIALIFQKLKDQEVGNENVNNQNSGKKIKSSPINIKLMDAQQIDKKFENIKLKFMGGDNIDLGEQMSISNQQQIQTLNYLKQQIHYNNNQ